jgi:3-deoxy-D-manno-octulosonic-acid transferase
MIWLYRLLFAPALLFLAPGYVLRMRRRGGYGEDFRQRFGAHPDLPRNEHRRRVWIQAVSVGEMLAIGPLLRELKKDGVEVYLTTTTSTGRRIAIERHSGLTAHLGYFPLDWQPFSARAWERIKPDLMILTEGERWPEHLRQAALRGVPVISLNSRLSDRTFRRLSLLGRGAKLCLEGISLHLAASRQDAERLAALGVAPERIKTVGNLKLDVTIEPLSPADAATLRSELGLLPGIVLLGSSTWPGEEAALLRAWRTARSAGNAGSLLLVPRHEERRAEIESLLRDSGATYHFRSRGPAATPVEVSVADTTGELRRLTQLADLVVVGKSLPPHTEGQSPVEAAALGKPILFGPGMANFRTIAAELLASGAAREFADANQLSGAFSSLLTDEGAAKALASQAATWHRANQGSLGRSLIEIRRFLA